MPVVKREFDLVVLCSRFYQIIAEIKHQHKQGTLEASVERQLDLNKSAEAEDYAYAISLRLQGWLEKTRKSGDRALTGQQFQWLNDALFAMVALADEVLMIDYKWEGQSHWQAVLLEHSLFDSCFAGTCLFERMDELINKRSYATMERQLAAVYLLVLRLGFKGRYRNVKYEQILSQYRQELFRLANQHRSEELRLCGQAYNSNLSYTQDLRLAPMARFRRGVWISLGIYLLIGFIAWSLQSWHLNDWRESRQGCFGQLEKCRHVKQVEQ